jgi:hypothetical protein
MLNMLLYQSEREEFITELVLYLFCGFIGFIICVYIVRAIFNIPKFIKLQKAQVRLLEEMAKNQGVDGKKVQSIISETYGWEGAPAQSAVSNTGDGK